MALAAGEVLSGGVVRDSSGRQVVAVDPSSSGLTVQAGGQAAMLPTGAQAETFSRMGAAMANQASVLSTGRLWLVGIGLNQGVTISSISFLSGTTALGTGTNQWFALYSGARALLATTVDDLANAWAGSSVKTLAVAKDVSGNTITSYTTTTSGLFYLGICVVATTVPTLLGVAGQTASQALAPAISGNSTAGLTTPASAPNPAAALGSTTASLPWAYVS